MIHIVKSCIMVMLIIGFGGAHALECIIESSKPTAIKVQWPTKDFSVFKQMASSNCEGTIIVEGDAIVYVSDEFGGLLKVMVGSGEIVSSSKIKSSNEPTGSVSSVIAQMRRLLKGEQDEVFGQKRSLVENEITGFPYRLILPPVGDLEVDVQHLLKVKLDSFNLIHMKSGKKIFSDHNITGILKISASKIQSGESYLWQARAGQNEYRGSFRVANIKEAREVADYLKDMERDKANHTILGKAISEASLYFELGYEFDSYRILVSTLH